ncbi:hypothetical protein Tco_1091305 [Tanacetum coccineum]|uniref:Uncharacterized protein n=1 Tax=Tanacetum coccineum TaxID=301880 RepID=A0ABQ5I8J7_9ASTR
MGKDKVFTINLHHSGVFIPNPIRNVQGELKQITYINFEDRLKRSPHLVSEPGGSRSRIYKVFEVEPMKEKEEDTMVRSIFGSFGTRQCWKAAGIVVIWLGKNPNSSRVWQFLGVVHNSYKDARLSKAAATIIGSNRVPVDQEPIEDPDDANIDLIFKIKRGVSYLKHDPIIPWNEMQPVLCMRYDHPEQLKLAKKLDD